MSPYFLRKKIIHYTLIFIGGLSLILIFDYLGFFVKSDNNLYDLYFRLRGSRNTDGRIIIAAIDEKTLEQLGRWPFSREYYAQLLEKTQGAKAVGFDVIMTESSEDDYKLEKAIKKHGNVVLAAYFDSNMGIVNASFVFSPAKTGHLHAEPGVDGIVREIYHSIYFGERLIPSFSSAIYEVSEKKKLNRSAMPFAVSKTDLENPVFKTDKSLINYYGPPSTFPYLSMSDIVEGRYSEDFFKDRIVLVGFTAPGVVDRVITPFSQQRNRMPGIEVHANILNNLIDRSAIRGIDQSLKNFLGFLVSSILFLLFARMQEKESAFLWAGAVVLASAISFMLFKYFNLWIGPVIFYLSFTLVFVTAYIYRLDEAARKMDMRYSSIISLPAMGQGVISESVPTKGLLSFLSAEGINARIQKLLAIEDEYEEKLQQVIDKRTLELSDALAMVKTMSNEVVLRLATAAESKDEQTGKHISRIGLYAKKLSEFLGMPGEFIEQITFASAMHDIGKIGIPDKILQKPGSLTPDEFEIMKSHTVIGEKILSDSVHPMIQMAASIALCHHEKWNGAGYPRGLKGTEIPLEARIVMLCDIYEALRSKRPYKKPMEHRESFLIITEGDAKISPNNFDPDVLQAFIKINNIFSGIFDEYSDR